MPRSQAASAGPIEPVGEIDLRAIGAALKRRRTAWLLPTLFAAIAVALFVNVVPPRFTAQTQILLENQETYFTRPDRAGNAAEASGQLDETAVASQVQLIGSADIARRAIKALHLEGNPEFDPLAGGMNPVARVLVLLGVLPDPTRETAQARILQTFGQKLTVFSPAKTRVVTIEFTSRDADLAARAANEVAALYLSEQSSAKRGVAKAAAESLAAQIAELRAKLADADAARERYRLSSGLLAGTNNMTISGQSLADINTDLSRARAGQADAQAKAATIRELLRDGRAADVADITNSPIVRQLWNQRSVAQATLATEAQTLLPEHPRVKELVAQVKEYDAALKSAAKQVATSLENDARVAGQRVANLESAVARQKTLAGAANSDEVRLAALDRVSQGFKDQLQSSTAKYEEAVARQGSSATPADARVISRASPPQEPSFPKKLPFLIFGTVATLVFAVGYVVASEILSGRADIAEPTEPAFSDRGSSPPSRERVAATPAPRRRATDLLAAVDDVETGPPASAVEAAAPVSQPVSEKGRVESRDAGPATSAKFEREAGLAGDEVLLAPVAPGARMAVRRGSRPEEARFRAALASVFGYVAAFGRSAAESGVAGRRSAGDAERPEPYGRDRSITPPVVMRAGGAAMAVVGWGDDVEDVNQCPSAAAPEPAPTGSVGSVCVDEVAQRIVDGHVPGRGLHVVGTGIGVDDAAAGRIIALARRLADKGRSIIVDLNATPAKLAPVSGGDNGLAAITMLQGLSELLAGEASFAEVIHRDHATRLHFIPTGREEADFRDFDLILDALTETYDFIVLLTPSFPQSEIAKVMAPYADYMVLSAGPTVAPATVMSCEEELGAAGANVVMAMGTGRTIRTQAVA